MNDLKLSMVGAGVGTAAELSHETVSPLKKGGTLGFDARENASLRIGGKRKRVQVRSVVIEKKT